MSTAELAVIALVRALVAKARKVHNGREGFWAIGAGDVRDLAVALEACEARDRRCCPAHSEPLPDCALCEYVRATSPPMRGGIDPAG